MCLIDYYLGMCTFGGKYFAPIEICSHIWNKDYPLLAMTLHFPATEPTYPRVFNYTESTKKETIHAKNTWVI